MKTSIVTSLIACLIMSGCNQAAPEPDPGTGFGTAVDPPEPEPELGQLEMTYVARDGRESVGYGKFSAKIDETRPDEIEFMLTFVTHEDGTDRYTLTVLVPDRPGSPIKSANIHDVDFRGEPVTIELPEMGTVTIGRRKGSFEGS